jgi:outer membrane lipoprotein-sorting protein
MNPKPPLFRWIAGGAAAAALLVAAGARADEKGDAVVAKARTALAKVKSLQADVEQSINQGGQTSTNKGRVTALKPGLVKFQLLGPDGKPVQVLYGDPKKMTVVMPGQKQYMSQPGLTTEAFLGQMLPQVAGVLNPTGFLKDQKVRYVGAEPISGQTYEVVESAVEGPGAQPATTKHYFDAAGLPVGAEQKLKFGTEEVTQLIWLRNIKLNPAVTPQQMAFVPPAGYKKFDPSSGMADLEKKLLKVGAAAPDFQLPQPGGARLELSEARKGKKAVLINFWFYG